MNGWSTSDEVAEVFAAMVNAVAELSDLKRTETAKVPMKSGGTYTYTYTELVDVTQAIRPVAHLHGLAVIQIPFGGAREVGVSTLIMHRSGQWISLDPLIMEGGTPQSMGSAISYARRYQLLPAFGLATQDDDGAAASKPRPARASTSDEYAQDIRDDERPSNMASAAQLTKIAAMLKAAGFTDRVASLERVGSLVGRTIESRNELTKAEASKVIEAL